MNYNVILQYLEHYFQKKIQINHIVGVYADGITLEFLKESIKDSYLVDLSDLSDIENMKVDLFIKTVAERM
ncbi:hypothetical protein MHB54_00515 [Paenibacillus sp. FSL M7-0802]|uniref:hypothetical protein n=1 Tax=Paenibacillus sp. FSL M7-0802 TaxID=2921536 RepID=UPI0030FA1B15